MKLLFSFILFVAPYASAFTLMSTDPGQTGWRPSVVTFKLNPTNCPGNIHELLGASLSLWNSVATSGLILKIEGTSSSTPSSLINGTATDTPVVACDAAFATTTGTDADSVIGVGFIGNSTRPIRYGALILNAQSGALANVGTINNTKAQIAVAHEIGHVLGIGHSADASALMYYNVSEKTKFSLAQDDMDGVSYLYPRNEFDTSLFMGCGSIVGSDLKGIRGSQGPGQLSLFVLLALSVMPMMAGLYLRLRMTRFHEVRV